MVVRIIVAGQSQCQVFAEICLITDYLSQTLPNFCHDRIEKPVVEWKTWLSKINQKNKWHHDGSPLVWKELLLKGSKPYYIGGASEFLEYCHSYYNFDIFMPPAKYEGLVKNYSQFQKKIKQDKLVSTRASSLLEPSLQTDFVVCILGAANPLTMHLISGLLEMSAGEKRISKIYIYDEECSQAFMEFVEQECSYIGTDCPKKVVKFVEKIGIALTHSDLLIIMDHVAFDVESSIGDWLHANMLMMHNIALMINASASRKMYILFPNLGPACFNATVLMHSVSSCISKTNIVVATSDLGLDIASAAAEIAEVPMRNMFCSPVWGFVGINHLVDINTTIHKYNTFEPYNRCTRVKNSTLIIGSLTPQMRKMEYLMYFDNTLWIKVAEKKKNIPEGQIPLNKAIAVLDVTKMWLFDKNPDYVVNLGILCDGSFGLTFNGAFSQPAKFIGQKWVPAGNYFLPKDPQMKLAYLENIANMMMKLEKGALHQIIPYTPCKCKIVYFKKQGTW